MDGKIHRIFADDTVWRQRFLLLLELKDILTNWKQSENNKTKFDKDKYGTQEEESTQTSGN